MAVIKELERRGTLKNALAGRDEEQLSRILHFLIGYEADQVLFLICVKQKCGKSL